MTKQSVFLVFAVLFCAVAKAGECDHMARTLAAMREKDQAVRERAMSDDAIKEMRTIDVANTRRLAHLLKVCAAGRGAQGRLTSE